MQTIFGIHCRALLGAGLLCLAAAATAEPPAAAGSLGPNLVRGADGTVVLSWLEPHGDEYALRYARWQAGAWQAPATVTTGADWFVNWADFPSVTPLGGELWAAHWLVRRPAGGYAYDVHAALSTDAGNSWSADLRPHRDDTDTEHGFVSIFPFRGAVGLVWLDGRRTGRTTEPGAPPAGMTLRAATLTPGGQVLDAAELDGLVCDCCQTDVAVTPDGPVAVYRDRTAGEIRDIFVSRYREGAWSPGEPVARDDWQIAACPVNGPVIRRNGAELAVAWFTAADDRPRVRLARAPGIDAPFSAPFDVVSDKALGRVGLALLDDGTAVVSALERGSQGLATLAINVVTADGHSGHRYVIAEDVSQFSVPQLLQVPDGLLLVWTSRTADTTRLRSSRVPLQVLR